MKLKVFIDTNVFIYSFEYPVSNSARILELLNAEEIEVVTSERVVKEITTYFLKFHSTEHARKFRRYIFDNCTVVMNSDVAAEINFLKGQIKEKDTEQLAVVKKYGIKFLLSYDRDFEGFEEYVTPRKFLQTLKKKTNSSEF